MLDAVGSASSPSQPYVPSSSAPTVKTEAAVAKATVRTTSSALIEIVTTDGDKVTISASAVKAASVAAAAGQSETPEGAASAAGTASSTTSSRSLAITVEGTLEKDEVADIRRLLTTLERGATQSERGGRGRGHHRGHDMGKHVEKAALDSLESFTATFKTSTTYAATAAYASVSSTTALPVPGTPPSLPEPGAPPTLPEPGAPPTLPQPGAPPTVSGVNAVA
jgi:hypothetical protein